MVIPVDGEKVPLHGNGSAFLHSLCLKLLLVCTCSVEFLPTRLFSVQARNKKLAKTMAEFDQPREAQEHEKDDLLDLLDTACSMK